MRLFSGLKNKYFDSFLGATGILFLSSGIVNVFNLIFWLYMVRRLSTIDYGILNSLFSLFMILSLPAGSLQTVVTKFISQFYSHKDFRRMRFFLFHLGKRIFIFLVLAFMLFVLFSPKIASFMNIPFVSLIIVTGMGLFISAIYFIFLATLQGIQNFSAMAIIGFVVGALKLVLGVGLVAMGFRVMGAMGGLVLSSLIGLIVVLFQMPKQLFEHHGEDRSNSTSIKFESVYSYFPPVAVGLFCFMVLTNIDIILVKHYFLPLEAGYYSVAQMVGKIIIFLPGAVSIVMFPKVVDSYSQNKDTILILKKSLLIVGMLCLLGTIISCLFPEFILNILTGKAHPTSIPLVRIFALAMSFFALVQILIYYHLSTHNFKYIPIVVFSMFCQVVLIALFHKSLIDVLYILLFVSISLFLVGIKLVKFKAFAR